MENETTPKYISSIFKLISLNRVGQHTFVHCVSRSEPQSGDDVQLDHRDTTH